MTRLWRWSILFTLLPMILVAERFTLSNSVVVDSKTALEWQSKPTAVKYNQKEAIGYCNALKYSGYSDWRLANLYELKSIVDYSKYNPAIATQYIEIQTDDWYWTSSEYKNDSSHAWVVYFNNGNDNWGGKSGKHYALCVRG